MVLTVMALMGFDVAPVSFLRLLGHLLRHLLCLHGNWHQEARDLGKIEHGSHVDDRVACRGWQSQAMAVQ